MPAIVLMINAFFCGMAGPNVFLQLLDLLVKALQYFLRLSTLLGILGCCCHLFHDLTACLSNSWCLRADSAGATSSFVAMTRLS